MQEAYRCIKAVDLSLILPVVPKLQFVRVGHSGKYPCDVAIKPFPKEVESFIQGLDLGGIRARAVFRKLAPRQSIPPHTDEWMPQEANWRRFQVPITSHPDIKMRWPDEKVEVHLEPGWLYEVRFDITHEVIHNADCERIHLQLDIVNATV